MAIDLSRQEYPAILASLQPAQAIVVLNERIKRIGRINAEVADWLQERRRVEEIYVQGLKKLARKQPPDDSSELGIFKTPWQKIVSSTDSLAQSHQVLAAKIEVDVERPLREFATKNREMQALTTIQGNLGAIAKDIESAQDKADKLKRKGAKAAAGKVAAATAEVEGANSSWESQAPFVFESLQAADETRLNHLRDVLTQLQTHEVDQVERNRVTAEGCLNALLNVETAVEIRAFAARAVASKPRIDRTRSNTLGGSTLGGPALAPPVPTLGSEETRSQQSADTADAMDSGYVHEASQSERFSGLKRLGTVIGKRRQSTYGRAPSPGRRSTKLFGGFGRADRDVPPLPLPEESTPSLTSTSRREQGLSPRELDSSPAAQRSRSRRRSRDQSNGYAGLSNPSSPASNGKETNGTGPSEAPHLQHDLTSIPFNIPEASTTDPKKPEQSSPQAQTQIQRDADGFTIPTSSNNPISQAEQEAIPDDAQPQFKLDIRENPIREEINDAETALANVASTLRAQAAPARRTGTVRGRRDVRNTIFIPSGQAPDILAGEGLPAQTQASPPKVTRATTLTSEEGLASDAQSVHSSRSLSSLANIAVKHPDMHQPGLNTSIVETVSAWFEHGQISKAVVIGEMALAYNAPDATASSTTTTATATATATSPPNTQAIRLENFPVLEKVAPNPTFITQLADRSGEYHVSLPSITRTSIAFKYQVHLDEATVGVHAPLTLMPAWKIEAKQASVILSYALNPTFALGQRRHLTLRNVSVLVSLDGAKPSACQSKPVGTFSKERGLIYWRLGDLTLEPGAAPTKVLARFTTESEAKPGAAEARWEINGDESAAAAAAASGPATLGSSLEISQQATTNASTGPLASAATAQGTDPFADTDSATTPATWISVPTTRRLVSGKYSAV
ncbi:MAG: hypothetical protein M1838_003707 [Thelocarpon superellum]|nr:MAG: hypothetical protein M1838_003707 [Thelocarpon superellum]